MTLLGARDEVLRAIEKGFTDVDIHVRGTAVTVSGPAARVDTVVVLLSELIDVARTGTPLTADAVERGHRLPARRRLHRDGGLGARLAGRSSGP